MKMKDLQFQAESFKDFSLLPYKIHYWSLNVLGLD